MDKHYQWRGSDLLLHCQLQPRASKDEIVGIQGDRLKIRITAPPVDGKANQHLIALAAKWFGTPKRAVTIVRGDTGRQKTLAIESPTTLPEAAAIDDNS
ncbi:MAG: YggU family protein [Gammaproteobacteria bacterium]|nr:MAG: YggU family protein [Gammaproteobacteria bacterium]